MARTKRKKLTIVVHRNLYLLLLYILVVDARHNSPRSDMILVDAVHSDIFNVHYELIPPLLLPLL